MKNLVALKTNSQPLSVSEKISIAFKDVHLVKLEGQGCTLEQYIKSEKIEDIFKKVDRRILSITPFKYYHNGKFESDLYRIISLANLLTQSETPHRLDNYFLNDSDLTPAQLTQLRDEILELTTLVDELEIMIKGIKKSIWNNYQYFDNCTE
ncbi:MAG TPA: hypothetical protein PLZ15_00540 [Melioribacteraceae bacterium]|nr:hypothetical protein [Melioribacteraceae bacterium]